MKRGVDERFYIIRLSDAQTCQVSGLITRLTKAAYYYGHLKRLSFSLNDRTDINSLSEKNGHIAYDKANNSNAGDLMEKLMYMLWDDREVLGRAHDQLRDDLICQLPKALAQLGAKKLTICVIDSDVAAGEKLHLGPREPHALVTFWLDCVGERAAAEAVLDTIVRNKAGYLVAESQPLKLPVDLVRSGERLPGFTLVGGIEPAPGVSPEEFIHSWETVHRQVAIDTQSTIAYARNEVVRKLTPDAPDWRGLVEEVFPIEALEDESAFYNSAGDPALLKKNRDLMVKSCMAFIDLTTVDSHPMSEYRFF